MTESVYSIFIATLVSVVLMTCFAWLFATALGRLSKRRKVISAARYTLIGLFVLVFGVISIDAVRSGHSEIVLFFLVLGVLIGIFVWDYRRLGR